MLTLHSRDVAAVQEVKRDYNYSLSPGSPESSEWPLDIVSIPKPSGSVGKPSQGGYTLSTALGWTPSHYENVLVCAVLLS
jgi:hypothetical protein